MTSTPETTDNIDGSVENVNRVKQNEDQIAGTVDDLKEELGLFTSDHMHYRNPLFISAEVTYQLLVDKESKKENLNLYFNSSMIVAKSEFSQNGFYKANVTPETNYVCFVTNEENYGDYEENLLWI